MILAMLAAFVVLAFVVWRRHKASEKPKLWEGNPTGVSSPYRTPARFFHNRRSL